MLAFLLACATAAPPPPPPEPPSVPHGETVTVRVPSDCPHIIVDIVSGGTSDVTVACFDRHSGRTHLQNFEAVPIGVIVDPTREDRLVVEFVERHKLPATQPVARQ